MAIRDGGPERRGGRGGGFVTRDELRRIVANGESSTVEFKTKEIHPGTLAEEMAALAQ